MKVNKNTANAYTYFEKCVYKNTYFFVIIQWNCIQSTIINHLITINIFTGLFN